MSERRTKIIGTIGPASQDVAVLRAMIESGLDFARLNFAHGTHASHRDLIRAIRQASELSGKRVEIIGDLHGSKVRLGKLLREMPILEGDRVRLKFGLEQTDPQIIPVGYEKLTQFTKPGDTLLLDDGMIELRVLQTNASEVVAEVMVGGILKSFKGLNFPNASLDTPAMSEKDEADLRFALSEDIDHVSLSFVKHPSDVEYLRRQMQAFAAEHGIAEQNLPLVIAKVERKEALQHLDTIPAIADAIMIDRGDLGSEVEPWHVPFLQKVIVRACRKQGKPVIIATQMLNSMITHPRPTRAEINDISQAIIERADMIMLSGETAAGKYPVEAVATMRRIIEETEKLALDNFT